MSAFDDIVYRTDDITRWGAGIGFDLPAEYIDNNFWLLDQRVADIENNPRLPLEIGAFTIDPITGRMTITLSDGYTSFGPFTIPVAAFRFTGEFQALFPYRTNDLVTNNENLYLVLHPFTSGATFEFGADIDGPFYALIMPSPRLFDIGFFYPGRPGYGVEIDEFTYAPNAMFSYRSVRDFYLPALLDGSLCGLRTAPAEDMVFIMFKNETFIGTIDFTAGLVDGVFTLAASVQFEAGDVFRVLRDSFIDLDARDLTLTVKATLGTI